MSVTQPEPGRRTLDAEVGWRVHSLMWDRKLTQSALGRQVGIDSSNLGKRLRGTRGWSLDELRATAAALGVSMGYLLGEDPVRPEGFEPPTF